METSPAVGGAGEAVPEVDPEDVKSVWELYREVEMTSHCSSAVIGQGLIDHACKEGANIRAVSYRTTLLRLLRSHADELSLSWTKDGKLNDALFRAAAQIPMEWMGVGVVRQGFPFDVDEFVRRVRIEGA